MKNAAVNQTRKESAFTTSNKSKLTINTDSF